jgi:glycosyltransferase involved in cell wall biosynthesis
MTKKKLLLVSTSFPQQPGDALSPFIWELCLHLSRLGWDITALVPHHKGLKDSEVWDGISIRRFRYLPERFEDIGYSGGIIPNLKKKPWRLLKMPFYILAMYREALRIAIEEKVDLVSFQWLFPASFWLGQFARSSDCPIILTGHGTDIRMASKGIFKIIADRAMKHAAALTVNSNYMKGLLSKNTMPPIAEVIFVGSDPDKFSPGDTRPSNSKTILYVGRLIKQKGIELLIEAFIDIKREIPDARLEIIGYGPELEHIVSIIKENNIESSVKITESVPHDSLPELYRTVRILTLPSLIPEGLGMTPVEAGLCGVPTVTFGKGGTSEIIINDKTGLVVESGRESLRDGLKKLLLNDLLTDQMGLNAREYLLQTITWQIVASKFDNLFGRAIDIYKQKQTPSKASSLLAAFLFAAVSLGYLAKMFVDRFERLLGLFR